MGREIKRIALDFDYPINKMIWKGYANPYRGLECKACDGSGQSPAVQKLSDDWYTHLRADGQEGWCYHLEQEDVQALVDAGRLWDFTRIPINDEQKEIVKNKIANGENSWLPFDNGYIPTAKEVNNWAKNGMGHDSINRWVCVKAKAKRLGITDFDCKYCHGEGVLWPDDKYAKLSEEFEYIEPPAGDGYQLWSTTTEGTPMSPVMETPEELAEWLYENEASSFGRSTASYEQWLSFIKGPGWAPSMMSHGNKLDDGVKAISNK